MKVAVYSKENKEVDSIDLPDNLFGRPFNSALIHQVVTAERANTRRPYAHTKGRGEVSGGGKKPWRQKHTGRARVGSTRSPIWIHGGVALGPRKERSYEQKVNRKMRWGALFSILSRKLKDGDVKILDSLEFPGAKTKEAAKVLKSTLPNAKATSLLVLKMHNETGSRALRNIPKQELVTASSISAYMITKNRNLVFEKAAVSELLGHYRKA